MISKIVSALGVLMISLAVVSMANSQDDNLADKMREKTGPELPTIDNIVQASKENIDILLGKQLKANIPNAKKHKPLLMVLVVRSAEGGLEFQREIVKLAAITHRQFEIAMGDCQFDRKVCEMFSDGA